MTSLLKIVVAVLIGVMLGLLYTIHVLDAGVGNLVAGPWQGAGRDGAPEVDPYTLAANDRSGVLPLGSAEGQSFIARTDSAGVPFQPLCDYAVGGPMPSARFWTLSLLDEDGFPVADPAERHGFTSAEILRQVDMPFAITIAPEARSGNWLPTGHAGHYVLMLRLYDTGLNLAGTAFKAGSMPQIVKTACR